MSKYLLGIVAVLSLLGQGCAWRPYDRPEYAEIETYETAYLVPLEGDTSNQAAFVSVEFLEQKKVAAKRIQILHRWNQTGYRDWTGEWIASVKLIKLDRRPVTREWTADKDSGTSSKDEAIHVETKDSIGFHMGVSCTAKIPEKDASTYLYTYPAQSLAQVMDMEVRTKIQEFMADATNDFTFDDIRSKKGMLMKGCREIVVPFFAKRGIEITAIAMTGGLTYDNKDIQKSIDEVAKATQLKAANEEKRKAQDVENQRMKSAAEGVASAAKIEAEGKANAEIAEATGKAQSKLKVAEADAESLKKIAANADIYLKLRTLEMEIEKLRRWKGDVPQYFMNMGNGSGSGFLIQPPQAAPTDKKNP